jgi:hypothetical protein
MPIATTRTTSSVHKFINTNYFLKIFGAITLVLILPALKANASTYFDFRTSTGTAITTHGDGLECSPGGANCKYVVMNLGQPKAAVFGMKYYALNSAGFNIMGGGCSSGALDIAVYNDAAYTIFDHAFGLAGSGTSPQPISSSVNFDIPSNKYAQLIFGCNDGGLSPLAMIDGSTGFYASGFGNTLTYTGLPNLCIGDTPDDCSVISNGTIQVLTNLNSASFFISGPAVFQGNGRSAEFHNVPAGAYTISYGPSCFSGLPANETKSLVPGQTLVFTAEYIAGFLSFPLDGFSPCTAPVSSVFDHSQITPYANNDTVSAYTGETGTCDTSAPGQICRSLVKATSHYGFTNSEGKAFEASGHYTGDSQAIKSFDCLGLTSSGSDGSKQTSCSLFLFYDGHPGFDYPATCLTPVRASVSGTVHYPTLIDRIIDGQRFHVLEIIPDSEPEYRIYYLHLATHPTSNPNRDCEAEPLFREGDHVNAGEIVGLVGHAGVISPHLHFEVHVVTNCGEEIPVDPYGWKPSTPDVYKRAVNRNLWK